MGEYEDGESSGYADWIGELLEVDALPDDMDLTPVSVAAFIVRLDREADLLAHTLAAVGIFPLGRDRTVPGVRAWAREHVLAGTDQNVPDEIRQVL